MDDDPFDEAAVVGGLALEAHYANHPTQTFHHAPSVVAVALDMIKQHPDLLFRMAVECGAVEPEWTLEGWLWRRTFATASTEPAAVPVDSARSPHTEGES